MSISPPARARLDLLPEVEAVFREFRVPAGLLCHRHDARLWNQRACLVRGTLTEATGGFVFRPTAFAPGVSIGSLRGFVGFIRGARRATRRYLAARGLARPRIPWDDINAIKAQAVREERGRRA